MDKKEIITNLIDIYIACINECVKVSTYEEMIDICLKYDCNRGVCQCSIKQLKITIYEEEWVVNNNTYHSNSSDYWTIPVEETENIHDLIASLEKRLNILQQEKSIA